MPKKSTKKSSAAETNTHSDVQAAMDSAMHLGAQLQEALTAARAELKELQAAREQSGVKASATADQKPSMGSMVMFRARSPGGRAPVELAATVAYVVDAKQRRVNLTVHAENGTTYPFHDAHYSEEPRENTWHWPTRS